jgi:hypothetical protein
MKRQKTTKRQKGTRQWSTSIVCLCGGVCGAVSLIAAFRNGQRIGGTSIERTLFGLAGVAIVIMSWFLPQVAASAWTARARVKATAATALWFIAASFTLIQAVGYVAHNRSERMAGEEASAWRINDARKHLEEATEALTAAKSNPLWQASSGCTAVSGAPSKRFCGRVAAKVNEIESIRRLDINGKTAVPDAQAATLAWATGDIVEPTWISKALPVFMAIVFELGAGLSFFAASPVPSPNSGGDTIGATAAHKAKPKRTKPNGDLLSSILKRNGEKVKHRRPANQNVRRA